MIDAQLTGLPLVRVRLRDGLVLSGFVARASYACEIYCRVPPDWLQDGQLVPEALEKVFEMLYGPTWRGGNEDGSAYAVLSCEQALVDPETEAAGAWRDLVKNSETQYWFCRPNAAGGLESVPAAEL